MKLKGKFLLIATLVGVAVLVGLLMLLVSGRSPRSIVVHCGRSMQPATEELAAEFERTTGAKVEFNFGGSETLLPFIVTARKGDIFVCHDPFGDLLRQKDLLEDSATVGQLVPVIIVARGNPLAIRALADLARPNVRVGLMDPRHTACGELTQNRLRDLGLQEAVQKNVKVEQRGHEDLATAIRMGHLDAAVVWNFIGAAHPDFLDTIVTGDPYPQTNVTICMLKCAANRDGARQFLKLAASEAGLKIYVRKGYVAADQKKP